MKRQTFCQQRGCGVPTDGKKFCERCVEKRLGVIVDRELGSVAAMAGWHSLGNGGLQRRNMRGISL